MTNIEPYLWDTGAKVWHKNVCITVRQVRRLCLWMNVFIRSIVLHCYLTLKLIIFTTLWHLSNEKLETKRRRKYFAGGSKRKGHLNLNVKSFFAKQNDKSLLVKGKTSSYKVLHFEAVCPVSREMRWTPAKFALAQVASHAFVSVTVPRASSCSRHQNASVHNTSLFAVTVRPTLIIYLLQFRLFSSIFHISSPHAPLPFTPLNGRRKKMYVCVSGIHVLWQSLPATVNRISPAARLFPNLRVGCMQKQKTSYIGNFNESQVIIVAQK